MIPNVGKNRVRPKKRRVETWTDGARLFEHRVIVEVDEEIGVVTIAHFEKKAERPDLRFERLSTTHIPIDQARSLFAGFDEIR